MFYLVNVIVFCKYELTLNLGSKGNPPVLSEYQFPDRSGPVSPGDIERFVFVAHYVSDFCYLLTLNVLLFPSEACEVTHRFTRSRFPHAHWCRVTHIPVSQSPACRYVSLSGG